MTEEEIKQIVPQKIYQLGQKNYQKDILDKDIESITKEIYDLDMQMVALLEAKKKIDTKEEPKLQVDKALDAVSVPADNTPAEAI